MEQALHPAYLPEGTRIGPWRLLHPLGRGAFGTVYRVEGVEPDASGPAALKLAHAPNDERFARSAGGVHRDVKGANILVRTRDARSFLVDFGSCHYQGASPLTWHPFPPGTLAYRPPEAFAHSLQLLKAGGPLLTYSARPADDVFALGVTAWRLVTGTYPPSPQPLDAQAHVWALDDPGPRPAHELNPRCGVELSTLIFRMLSARPEARGSAVALAEALERTAREAGLDADVPLFLPEAGLPSALHSHEEVNAPALHQKTPVPETGAHGPAPDARGSHWRGPSWLTTAGLVSALGIAALYTLNLRREDEATRTQALDGREEPDAGTVGVGDAVLTAPAATPRAPSTWFGIALDLPARAFPGQSRPDANGRCRDKLQAAINGGCWWKLEGESKDCTGQTYAYRGKCYLPAFDPQRPPTSGPTDAPDGGAR